MAFVRSSWVRCFICGCGGAAVAGGLCGVVIFEKSWCEYSCFQRRKVYFCVIIILVRYACSELLPLVCVGGVVCVGCLCRFFGLRRRRVGPC